jgi:hypothetical protein
LKEKIKLEKYLLPELKKEKIVHLLPKITKENEKLGVSLGYWKKEIFVRDIYIDLLLEIKK